MKMKLGLYCILAIFFCSLPSASAVMTGKVKKPKKIESSFSFTDYFQKIKSVTSKQVAKSKKQLKKSKAKLAKAKAKAVAKGKGSGSGLAKAGILLMILGVIAGFVLWILGITGVGSFLFRLGVILVVIGVVLWVLGLIF